MAFTEINVDNVQDLSGNQLISSGLSAPGFELMMRQSARAAGSNVASKALAFTNNVGKKNNLLIAVIQWQPASGANTITISSVTDTLLSTWTQLGSTLNTTTTFGTAMALAVFTAPAAGQGADTVTATLSGTATGAVNMAVYEMYGATDSAPSVDVSHTNTGSGTALTSGTLATIADYDWVLEIAAANTAATMAAGTGYTAEQTAGPFLQDKAAGTAGNYSFAGTLSANSDWASVIIGFKPSVSARGGYGMIGRTLYRNQINETGGVGQTGTAYTFVV